MESWEDVRAVLPVSVPLPRPDTVEGLWPERVHDVIDELARNPDQVVRWRLHIDDVLQDADRAERDSRGVASSIEQAVLGSKLSTPETRLALKRVVDVFERAIQANPRSYRLWRDYLKLRSTYVLGPATRQIKLNAPKKKRGEDGLGRSMADWLEAGTSAEHEELDEGERDMDSGWPEGLDPVAGWEEWRALAATFERALMWLPLVRFT